MGVGGRQLEFYRFSADTPKPVSTSGRTGLTGFLEDKTGVTGAGTLGVGVAAYLISKEIYIINNETVIALVMGGVIYAVIRKVGQPITEYIDDRNQVSVWKYCAVIYYINPFSLPLSLNRESRTSSMTSTMLRSRR